MLVIRSFFLSLALIILSVESAFAQELCRDFFKPDFHFATAETAINGTNVSGTIYWIRDISNAEFPIGEELAMMDYRIQSDVLRVVRYRTDAQRGVNFFWMLDELTSKYPQIQKLIVNFGEQHISADEMVTIEHNLKDANHASSILKRFSDNGWSGVKASTISVGTSRSLVVTFQKQ